MNVVHFYGFNFLSLHSSKWSEVLARPGRVGTSRERRAGGHAGLCSAQSALPMCCVHAAPTLEIEHMSTSDIRDPEGEDHVV